MLQELINVRNDFKLEIQKLGDLIENCLSVSVTTSSEDDSDIHANVVNKDDVTP